MQVYCNLFPGGRKRALTMSYDDGHRYDLRLAGILDRYGLRGTFHVNSGNLGQPGYLTGAEVKQLSLRHEISVHTVTHPHLEALPLPLACQEIARDRQALETLTGQVVCGMSYPFGSYSSQTLQALRCSGVVYSRTVEATGRFDLPEDFLLWHPSAHHNDGIARLWEQFSTHQSQELQVLYVWGHGFELEGQNTWGMLEEFCGLAGGRPDVWYATNLEIYRYTMAVRSLEFSMDGSLAYNPSAIPVWVSVEGRPVELSCGATTPL